MSRRPASALLASYYFATFAALGAYLPYFPLWLESHGFFGLRMSVISALVPGLSALGPPLLGRFADARGLRGNLLLAACTVAAASMTGLCLADVWGLGGEFALVFCVVAVFASCRPPLIMLVDRIAIEAGGSYGRRRLWGSIGFLSSVLVVGRLWPRDRTPILPALVAAAFALGALLAFYLPRRAPPRPPLPHAGARGLLRRPRFVAFLCVNVLFFVGHASYNLCASLFFRDLGADNQLTGWLWACSGVAEVVLMGAMGRRAQAFRPELWLLASLGVGVVRWGWMALLPSAQAAFFLQPLHGICFGLNLVASLEFVRREVGTEVMGVAQGLAMAAQSVGLMTGMLVWGPLYHHFGGRLVYGSASALTLLAATLAYWALVAPQRRASLRVP